MLPDLNSIRLFLRAVQLKSLSRAADGNHMSLSAASRRIALLEHQFGTPLLERRHDGVTPTAAGEALARHAQTLMHDAEAMRADLSDYAQGAVGKVRLHANTSAMSQQLPGQLASWSEANPSIKIDVQELRSGDIVEAVRAGDADIGVVTTDPVGDLRFEAYAPDPLCVIVPQAHRLRGRRISFAELLDFELVGLDDSASITRTMRSEANALGGFLRFRVQVQSFEALCRLVAARQGVGVLPRGAVEHLKQPMQLRSIDLSDAWATRQMYICARKGRLPQQVSRFAAHLTGGEWI